tara:strand:+ start:183 stop:479 length:297 start_codon:yes stop_codon:yes gene_type:complete
MAIQKNKIPTPTEIKSSPTSFTEEELKELNNLSDSINELNSQFGVFYINKIKLEEAENTLRQKLKELEVKEKNMAKKLSDKYGKGSIDLKSGTFTPLK